PNVELIFPVITKPVSSVFFAVFYGYQARWLGKNLFTLTRLDASSRIFDMLTIQVTGCMLCCASRVGLMMRYERRAAASLSPKARSQLRVRSLAIIGLKLNTG